MSLYKPSSSRRADFYALANEERVEGFDAILEKHSLVFLDDYKMRLVDRIFPRPWTSA